jgi:hypothetical protein
MWRFGGSSIANALRMRLPVIQSYSHKSRRWLSTGRGKPKIQAVEFDVNRKMPTSGVIIYTNPIGKTYRQVFWGMLVSSLGVAVMLATAASGDFNVSVRDKVEKRYTSTDALETRGAVETVRHALVTPAAQLDHGGMMVRVALVLAGVVGTITPLLGRYASRSLLSLKLLPSRNPRSAQRVLEITNVGIFTPAQKRVPVNLVFPSYARGGDHNSLFMKLEYVDPATNEIDWNYINPHAFKLFEKQGSLAGQSLLRLLSVNTAKHNSDAAQ